MLITADSLCGYCSHALSTHGNLLALSSESLERVLNEVSNLVKHQTLMASARSTEERERHISMLAEIKERICRVIPPMSQQQWEEQRQNWQRMKMQQQQQQLQRQQQQQQRLSQSGQIPMASSLKNVASTLSKANRPRSLSSSSSSLMHSSPSSSSSSSSFAGGAVSKDSLHALAYFDLPMPAEPAVVAQKYGPYFALPPFERPTIRELLVNFVQLKCTPFRGQMNKSYEKETEVKQLAHLLRNVFNRFKLPTPAEFGDSSPDCAPAARKSYALNYNRWCAYCICEGTLVTLPDGRALPIEQLAPLPDAGGQVLALTDAGTGVAPHSMTAFTFNGARNCVELTLADGRKLVCTSDHRIRLADGRWLEASSIELGKEIVASVEGPACPITLDDKWQIDVRNSLGRRLSLATRADAEVALAFARLVGRMLSDGALARQRDSLRARLFFGHQLDVDSCSKDVRLVAGRVLEARRDRNTFRIDMPSELAAAFGAVGCAPGARVDTVAPLPTFLRDPKCPVPVVREFLGGLFGGDGIGVSVSHETGGKKRLGHVGFVTTRKGPHVVEQREVLRTQLVPMLIRCGLELVEGENFSLCTQVAVNELTEEARANVRKRKREGKSIGKVAPDAKLHDKKFYGIYLMFSTTLTLPFAENIGFRHCCHKQMRLAAAAACYRTRRFVADQRRWLAAKTTELEAGRKRQMKASLVEAKRSYEEEVGPLHPYVAKWAPTQRAALNADAGQGSSSSTLALNELLDEYGIAEMFSEAPKKKRYNKRQRQKEFSAAAVSSSSSSSSRRRYGVPPDANEWPTFQLKLIGRRAAGQRRVYDITVPLPSDPTDGSFVANGVVVHNCYNTKPNGTTFQMTNIFGRTMFRHILPLVEVLLLAKRAKLPKTLSELLPVLFRDLRREISSDESLILLVDFAARFNALVQLDKQLQVESPAQLRHPVGNLELFGAAAAASDDDGVQKAVGGDNENENNKDGDESSSDGQRSPKRQRTSSSSSSSTATLLSREAAYVPQGTRPYYWSTQMEGVGLVECRAIANDGGAQSLLWLNELKAIFGKQLPKMPKAYIARLVFDKYHRSIVLLQDNEVIGGVAFRTFSDRGFVEIAFLAIQTGRQIRGLGTLVLNNLKEYMKQEGVVFYLTFADNFAIPFFRKQGFKIRISQPRERWVGWIKDYEGGTLMECRASTDIDYLSVKDTIHRQRAAIFEKIKEVSNSHIVYPGVSEPFPLDIANIRGLKESAIAGQPEWRPEPEPDMERLTAELRSILQAVLHHPDAWPFLYPVDPVLVPDYPKIVRNPIDLQTIGQRLDSNAFYRTKHIFCADLLRMCNNCRLYNRRDTAYYHCADSIERFLRERTTLAPCMPEPASQD
jgi:histone acetyltransferase